MKNKQTNGGTVKFAYRFSVFISVILYVFLVLYQIINIKSIGKPSLSNFDKNEIIACCAFIAFGIYLRFLRVTKQVTNNSLQPPHESYLRMEKRMRVFSFCLFLWMFISA